MANRGKHIQTGMDVLARQRATPHPSSQTPGPFTVLEWVKRRPCVHPREIWSRVAGMLTELGIDL